MAIDLNLSQIRTDGGTQPRGSLDMITVEDYANAMHDGATFPPVVVFFDGKDHWLADGFHRRAGAEREGWITIAADVRQGTRRDAVLYSVGANASHGLRRSNADKRRSVETLLRDDEWRQWSDHEIARRTGVDPKTVGNVRRDLAATMEIPQSDTRRGADGRTQTITAIGTAPRPASPPPTAPAAPTVIASAPMPAAPAQPAQPAAAPQLDLRPATPPPAPATLTMPKAEPPAPPPLAMTPKVEAATAQADVLIARIMPGTERAARRVMLTVGVEGQMPKVWKNGSFADLPTLVDEALTSYYPEE